MRSNELYRTQEKFSDFVRKGTILELPSLGAGGVGVFSGHLECDLIQSVAFTERH